MWGVGMWDPGMRVCKAVILGDGVRSLNRLWSIDLMGWYLILLGTLHICLLMKRVPTHCISVMSMHDASCKSYDHSSISKRPHFTPSVTHE